MACGLCAEGREEATTHLVLGAERRTLKVLAWHLHQPWRLERCDRIHCIAYAGQTLRTALVLTCAIWQCHAAVATPHHGGVAERISLHAAVRRGAHKSCIDWPWGDLVQKFSRLVT